MGGVLAADDHALVCALFGGLGRRFRAGAALRTLYLVRGDSVGARGAVGDRRWWWHGRIGRGHWVRR